jgi:hypothetical protein
MDPRSLIVDQGSSILDQRSLIRDQGSGIEDRRGESAEARYLPPPFDSDR